MNLDTTIQLVPGKCDVEVAEDIKKSVFEALTPVCLAMDEAKRLGFEVEFSINLDWRNKSTVKVLDVVKRF